MLAQRLDMPHIELDALHWDPGWQPADPDVLRKRIEEAAAGPRWVMDGNYTSAVRVVPWDRVDTLVFLDYSLPVIVWRVVGRTLHRAVTGAEIWNGNRESWRTLFSRDSIVLWALTTHRRRRRQYRELIRSPETSGVTVIHLRSPREARRWLQGVMPRPADRV
jgi:adenylate kinase family enzyme